MAIGNKFVLAFLPSFFFLGESLIPLSSAQLATADLSSNSTAMVHPQIGLVWLDPMIAVASLDLRV
jgi:hypothetical protein